MNKCCEDLGNWFFQYLTQDNKKAYECCECDEVHFIVLSRNLKDDSFVAIPKNKKDKKGERE